MHEPPVLRQIDETHVLHRGRRLVYFGGSDYLRMSWHPKVRSAVSAAAAELGINSAASRSTTGNQPVYGELEARLKRFFRVPAVTVVSAGYFAPLIAAQALASQYSAVLLDERSHACLRDAAQLTGLPVREFPHRDPEGLGKRMNQVKGKGRLLVMTDGLFSTTGDAAPVREYMERLSDRGTLLIDDAHGVGALGANGRGTVEWSGANLRNVIVTGTLSKALGSYGGFVLGPASLRAAIFDHSRMFIGNTPVPPPCAAGSMASLEVLREEGESRRQRLVATVRRIRAVLGEWDPSQRDAPGPMMAVVPRDTSANNRLRRALLEADIYPPLIRYAGGPAPMFYRLAVSSEHSVEQVDALESALRAGLGTKPTHQRR
ncbi:MAG: aminotransferase class I/II-fold pyridoxal phosphate-dependent enzyme [Verrucomicrobiales bacterium]|nr:aminotransferase class I/II-fold pyridoxal phosphate-dependent enzyme [Verrucomicrobiales bacterium]